MEIWISKSPQKVQNKMTYRDIKNHQGADENGYEHCENSLNFS